MSSENVNLLINEFTKIQQTKEKVEILKKLASFYQDDRALSFLVEVSFNKEEPALSFQAKKIINSIRRQAKSEGIDIDQKLKTILFNIQLNLLKDEDYKVRIEAIQNISSKKNDKVFRILVEIFEKESHPFVIATLVKALAKTGGSKALSYIRPCLESEDDRVRANTVEALEIIEVRESFELLKKMLFDSAPRVKINAAKAIWKYSKLEAIDFFKKILKEGSKEEKKGAVYALSNIVSLDARNLLALMMNDPDIEIRLQASVSLSKLEERIREIISREGSLKEIEVSLPPGGKRIKRLEKVEEEQKSSEIKKEDIWEKFLSLKDQSQKIAYLQEISKKALDYQELFPRLKEYVLKEEDKFILSAAVKTLGSLAYEEKYRDEFFNLCEDFFLKHSDERVRANTIEALSNFVNERTINIVSSLLLDLSNRVKANVIKLIWEFDRKKAKDKIIEMVQSKDQFQISSALFLLENIKGEEAQVLKKEVESLLESYGNVMVAPGRKLEEVRENVSLEDSIDIDTTFLNLATREQLTILSDLSQQREKRIKAATFLGYLAEKEEEFEELVAILKKEKDQFVKATLVKSIAQVGGEKAIPIITPYLKDLDNRVRANTVEALGYIFSDKILPYLEMALYDSDNRVQANAIQVLWFRNRKKAKQRLMKMKMNPESWVRRSVVYLLSRLSVDDEEMLEELKSFTNDPDIEVALYAGEMLEKVMKDIETKAQSKVELQYLDLENFSHTFIETNCREILDEIFFLLENERKDLEPILFDNLGKILSLNIDFSYLEEKLQQIENKFLLATLVKKIGFCKRSEVVEILVKFLSDEDSRVRANTVEALSFISPTLKYRYFFSLLDDEDTRVFCVALGALWDTFSDDCLNKLVERIQGKDIFLLERLKYTFSFLKDPLGEAIYETIKDLNDFGQLQKIDFYALKEKVLLSNNIPDEKVRVERQETLKEEKDKKENSASGLLQEDVPIVDAPIILEDELEEEKEIEKLEKTEKRGYRKQENRKAKRTTNSVKQITESKGLDTKKKLVYYVILGIVLVLLGLVWILWGGKNEKEDSLNLSSLPQVDRELSELERKKLEEKARLNLDLLQGFLKAKEYKKVVELSQKYLENYPHLFEVEAKLYLALAYYNLKKYSKAKELFKEVEVLKPELKEKLDKYIAAIDSGKTDQTENLMASENENSEKEIKIQEEDSQKEDKIKTQSESISPQKQIPKEKDKVKKTKIIPFPKPIIFPYISKEKKLLHKAKELMLKGNTNAAIKIYEEILSREPKNPEANKELGFYYYGEGKFDLAMEHLLKALPYLFKDGEVYVTIGDILKLKGDYVNAIRFFKKGLKYSSNDYVAMLKLGEIYNLSEKYEEAREILQKIPQDYEGVVSYQIAISYLGEGNKVKAAYLFKRLKENYPDKVYGYIGLGRIYYETGDYLAAIKILKKALTIDPNNLEIKKYLLLTYLATNQIKKAIKLYPEACQGKVIDKAILASLAPQFLSISDYPSAEKIARLGVAYFPDEFIFYEVLGKIAKLKENFEVARHYFQEALKRSTKEKDKDRIKKELSLLK